MRWQTNSGQYHSHRFLNTTWIYENIHLKHFFLSFSRKDEGRTFIILQSITGVKQNSPLPTEQSKAVYTMDPEGDEEN